jgi:hypothetical protein
MVQVEQAEQVEHTIATPLVDYGEVGVAEQEDTAGQGE